MPEDAIALRTTYEVPLIWLDRAHGRERLASVPAEATFRLRQVESVDLRGIEGSLHDDVRFEGRAWRAVGFVTPDVLGSVRQMMWNDGRAACSWLALGLPTKLTTRAALGAFEESGMPARIEADAVERLDAQALERARLAVERDLLWDGRTLRHAAGHHLGVPEELKGFPAQVLDCVGGAAINLLEHVADFAARDPEAGRLAAEVRRVAVRGLVHAIPADGIEAAVHKVDRLAEAASRRAPGRAARSVAGKVLEMTRARVIPGLEAPPSREDEDSLAGLAP